MTASTLPPLSVWPCGPLWRVGKHIGAQTAIGPSGEQKRKREERESEREERKRRERERERDKHKQNCSITGGRVCNFNNG